MLFSASFVNLVVIRGILSVGDCIKVKLRKQGNVEQMNCDKNFIHTWAWRDILQHVNSTSNPVAMHGFLEVRDENIM